MLTIFIRSILLYLVSLLAMRIMGKRQVGQLQPFELVVVIMIAELAATPMGGIGIPMLYGVLPMVAVIVCHGFITAVCMKWQPFRTWMCGQPTVLIRNGLICEKQLRRDSVDLNDLMEAIRTAGILDPSEVGTAVLEPGGQINVFPKADFRPVTPDDLNLQVPKDGLPLPLVLDGTLQPDNLTRAALTEGWVADQAAAVGIPRIQEVLFMCLNTQGVLIIQGKARTDTHIVQAIDPEKVVW